MKKQTKKRNGKKLCQQKWKLQKNKTWELTCLPAGIKPIGIKWVFKMKLNEAGKVDKFKARLVAKWYAKKYGINYIAAQWTQFD